MQLRRRRGAGVHTDEVGPVALLSERLVGAEDGVGEGFFVPEGRGEGAVEGLGEGVGVAGLLVEEEDAGSRVAGGGRGEGGRRRRRGRKRRWRRRRRRRRRGVDLGREPGACELDAFERVAAVNVPGDVVLAAGFAAAGPAYLFEAADECGREVGLALGIFVAEGGEVGVYDGDGEAGVGFLEVGGQAEFDVVE